MFRKFLTFHMPKQIPVFKSHLRIPAGTVEIQKRAYEGNKNICLVSVPGTVKTIGQRAFADCVNLREIRISEGVETIEADAFAGCKNLHSIKLPFSIRQVNGGAFWNSGLKTPVLNAMGDKLIFCPSDAAGTAYTVPDGVHEIGTLAFAELAGLEQVVFPESLRIIRKRAFHNCGIKSLLLPENACLIEEEAFYHCRKLKTIEGLKKYSLLKAAEEFWRMQGECLAAASGTDLPKTRHWEETGFRITAQKCAEGKADAMYEMAEYFRAKAKEYPDVAFYVKTECFWLYRAYRYGNQKAVPELEKWIHSHPGKKLLIQPLSGRLSGSREGLLLNAAGFLDFEEERNYCCYGADEDGIVLVRSFESEDGPDEDGFGRETYYDWWYCDDCLNFIPEIPCLHSYSVSEMDTKTAKKWITEMHALAVRIQRERSISCT